MTGGASPSSRFGSYWASPKSRYFAQPDIQPHRSFADFSPAERRGGRHALEVGLGVSPLAQHRLEDGPGDEGVDQPELHPVHFPVDRRVRGVFVHVDDQRLAARPENAMHFAERAQRIGEVLERRPADDEIKTVEDRSCAARRASFSTHGESASQMAFQVPVKDRRMDRGELPAPSPSVIDRLHRAGLANREPDPQDRRKVLVRVPPPVLQRILPIGEPARAWISGDRPRQTQGLRHRRARHQPLVELRIARRRSGSWRARVRRPTPAPARR